MTELPLDAAGTPLPRGSANRRGNRRGHAHYPRYAHGRRLRGLIVVLWRAGLRIHEALMGRSSDCRRLCRCGG
jgi:hypothetical protein